MDKKTALKLLEQYKETGTKEAGTKITSGALSTIGYILLNEKKADAALKIFEKKAAWFPNSKTVDVDLAKIYAAMGDKEKTIYYLKRAIEKDTYNTRAMELQRILE